jgi:hypothetical protein
MIDIVLHDEPLNLDAVRLVGRIQASRLAWRGHAVVADQRIGQHENLTAVRRVGQRFDISRHRGVEHDFAAHRAPGSELEAAHDRAVLQFDSPFILFRHLQRMTDFPEIPHP